VKGQRFPSEHALLRDPDTGAVLHRLTSAPCINHATYFLQSPLTPDGRTLLFTSYRTGDAQLFAIDGFPGGPIVQWTDAAPVHAFSAAIRAGGEFVVFVRGGEVWEIERATLRERRIAAFDNAQLGEVSVSSEGEWCTAAARIDGQHGLVAGKLDASGWVLHPFPRTVIHPQFHPLESEWIEFAADPAPRMHRIRRDGAGLECLYQHGNDEFVVHETFLGKSADLVYTVWPHSLWRMDWLTRERSKICDFNAWHITPSRDGRLILCDTNHPDTGLWLIDAATGARRHICATRSSNAGSQWRTSRYALAEDFERARKGGLGGSLSWMESGVDTVYGPQWTHPHPSFSPDERWAFFTSDQSGNAQVYAVELASVPS
jgi:hypothetical protein